MATARKPQRTCLGCRTSCDQNKLVRFVRSPEGNVLADYRKKLPGRGAYVCGNRQCLDKAARQGGFARSFKCAIMVDADDLIDQVAAQMRQGIENLLGMARKSGQSIGGSNLVIAELQRQGEIALVLLAKDISTRVGDKVRHAAGDGSVRDLVWLDKGQLGKICGRAERSVLALRPGQIADKLLDEFSRFDQIAGDC